MKTVIAFGGDSPLAEVFSDDNIVYLERHCISQMKLYKDIRCVVISTSLYNGRTNSLIKEIRNVYKGIILVLVAQEDASICGTFIQAGADDILYFGNTVTKDLQKAYDYCELRNSFCDNLQTLKLPS